jgi:putative protein-disulfide isomerase
MPYNLLCDGDLPKYINHMNQTQMQGMPKSFRSLVVASMLIGACSAQPQKRSMNEKNNPLLCDPETGICEMPGAVAETGPVANPVKIIYFTDPICSACWSIEPQLRKLLLEYAGHIKLEHHMGGLLPSWEVYNAGSISKPSDVAHHWEEMSKHFGMPIDGDVWLKDPLNSSYPPCIAFKAAELQGEVKASNFLRRIREMVFLENKNITKWEHIRQAALESGLDTAQLSSDYNGKAQQLFRDDLSLAGQFGVRGFPALYFRDSLNNQTTIYGFRPYADFEQALRKLLPDVKKASHRFEHGHLFNHYSTMTTIEYSTLAEVNITEAEKQLTELEKKGKITKYNSKNGVLWKRKISGR